MKIFRFYLSQNNFQKLLKSAFGDSPIIWTLRFGVGFWRTFLDNLSIFEYHRNEAIF